MTSPGTTSRVQHPQTVIRARAMLKSAVLRVMRAVIAGDARVAEHTARIARVAVNASNVMVALYVPTAMASLVIHVTDVTAQQNVLIVAVAPNAINAMVSDKSIMDMDHLTTGCNVVCAAEVEDVINVLMGNVGIVTEQEYGHAASVMETVRATHVQVADYARDVEEPHPIAMFV